MIRRAQSAQQEHLQKHDVQLEIPKNETSDICWLCQKPGATERGTTNALLHENCVESWEVSTLITNDPVVNHAVDQNKSDSSIPYDETLYKEEIKKWQEKVGWILGWIK